MEFKIQQVQSVSSTQDFLRGLIQEGTQEGTVVLAEHQTKGRGRSGRTWFSLPQPQIYASMLLRPSLLPTQLTLLNISVGLAIVETLEEMGLQNVGVKWPNDVYVNGRKISGVLSELTNGWLIVGVGINVSGDRADFPSELESIATTASSELGKSIDRLKLFKTFLKRFETRYGHFLRGEVEVTQTEFAKRWIYRDRPIEVVTGDLRTQGRAKDIDTDGALLLAVNDNGSVRIVSGEVRPL